MLTELHPEARFRSPYLEIITFDQIFELVQDEAEKALRAYGDYGSTHEIYAVIKEELDEYWESVKNRNADPHELMQIASSAIFAILWIAKKSREEIDDQTEKT